MRPSLPEPKTVLGSILFSSAMRLAAGLSLPPAASGLAASLATVSFAAALAPLEAARMAAARAPVGQAPRAPRYRFRGRRYFHRVRRCRRASCARIPAWRQPPTPAAAARELRLS